MLTEDSNISRHRRGEEPQQDTLFKIRQILNISFIVLAIVAIAVYAYGVWYRSNERIEMMGVILAITAVVIKMSESMLRLKK